MRSGTRSLARPYPRAVPLTFAHPIAVVPLRRLGLPLPALAIGAMIPDMVLYAPLPFSYAITHSLLGLLTVDLVAAALVLVVWERLLRAPLQDACPSTLRDCLPSPVAPLAPLTLRAGGLTALALLIGAATHIGWDMFSHADGWMVQRWAALRSTGGPLPVYQWVQYLSSALGLVGLAICAMLALHRTPRRATPRHVALAPAVLAAPLVLGALAATALVIVGWGVWAPGTLIFMLITRTAAAMALGLAAASAVWWLLRSAAR